MPTLDPSTAAAIARGVYRLREDSIGTVADRGQRLGCEGLFAATDSGRFEGVSGGLAWKKFSGFGFIAAGQGAYAGELLIATRGTAMSNDWLTNLNIGLQIGPGSLPVHAGFNDCWKSFAPDLRAFLRGRNPSHIHCVGHSLGGALASLNADLLTAGNVAAVSLYTFGSPRTGGHLFAGQLSRRVSPANIHRVAHPADPVPMIPLFPFAHVPFGAPALSIANTENALISVGAHSMEPSYIPGVAGLSWAALAQGAPTVQADPRSFLEQAAAGHGRMLMGSASLLTMIGRALRWVLGQAGSILAAGAGIGLTSTATVLDQMAYLIGTGARLSKELGTHVVALIRAIFRFLGRTAQVVGDITIAFIRWTLDLLFTSLATIASRALGQVR